MLYKISKADPPKRFALLAKIYLNDVISWLAIFLMNTTASARVSKSFGAYAL
jgi:hypothetical protein